MLNMRRYKMTVSTYKRLKAWGKDLRCRRCGEPIKVGETVISTSHRRCTRLKLYHVKCYEEMKL